MNWTRNSAQPKHRNFELLHDQSWGNFGAIVTMAPGEAVFNVITFTRTDLSPTFPRGSAVSRSEYSTDKFELHGQDTVYTLPDSSSLEERGSLNCGERTPSFRVWSSTVLLKFHTLGG
ncbi:hypothetical protein F5Y15DRAFT_393128 [Xylariaceae sp. FL0016]|nr:hypothetical protein F5Y15DRAFT_393128 [Xylariaceae sp. FL0016]